jgi:hypothetical protein
MVTNMITRLLIVFVFLSACGFATQTRAKNVDLSTVPKRDTVSLTIYNSEDITLVRETRTVTFKKGVNPLQFSWANTLIDPTSVELRFISHADQLDVLDTTFPHDKPQMLYWNVQSDVDGEATIEITYFTSGITWSADYLAIADKDETNVRFDGFVRVTNNSGEEYEDASVRLIVGTINLVEKIAQLAQIPMAEVDKLAAKDRNEFKEQAARRLVKTAAGAMGGAGAAPPAQSQPKEIIKEGLSEYFVFTIEGTETIRNGWSKRMRAIEADKVPLKIQYRYRPAEYGDQLVRMYLMTNDTASTLGETPLPDGVVRVFKESGRSGGGLSYVTQQPIKYIPIGDKIELNLGRDPEVVFDLVKRKTWRDNIWVQLHGVNVFREVRPGQGVDIDERSSVAGWDDHEIYTQRIRNYMPKPIDVEVRRPFPGHIKFRSALKPPPTLHDYQTVQYTATAKPGEKLELTYEIVRLNGRNAKQNNVTLETAEVKP